jgi:hypothetical protein
MTRTHRLGALFASAALLASLTVATVAAPASAGPACTYNMATDMQDYDPTGAKVNFYPLGTALSGEVVCGGPGKDYVKIVDVGGIFIGRGGSDEVLHNHGKFYGGPGNDGGTHTHGTGKSYGGSGNDSFANIYGKFYGGPGNDTVGSVHPIGVFRGDAGRDTVTAWLYGTFIGGRAMTRCYGSRRAASSSGASAPIGRGSSTPAGASSAVHGTTT